jgi:hypothetical protein
MYGRSTAAPHVRKITASRSLLIAESMRSTTTRSLPKSPHAPRNRQPHNHHVHPEPGQNIVQRKRPSRVQRRQRQNDVPHHQLHRHPEKQPAHNPMLGHKPQPPANHIKYRRRRTRNKVVQHEPKHINSRPAAGNHSRPKQPRCNHLRNIPPKQNTSLQNIQRPRHKPRNPDRRHRIPFSSHAIP